MWRLQHEDQREYTWSRNNPFIARRLDYIFTSSALLPYVESSQIKSIPFSDHRLIKIEIKFNQFKKGHLTGNSIIISSQTQNPQTRLAHCLSNSDSEENMRNAILASFFHSTFTDEDPHHLHCPEGEESWCFFQGAEARGEDPRPHAQHCGTAITRQVAIALIPIYQRFSSSVLLKTILHGKTQNVNGALNNLIWVHCPKTKFVGKLRIEAAVHQAVCKFNRGNFHLAEVMENMNIPATEATLAFLERDNNKIKKADAAADAAVVVQ